MHHDVKLLAAKELGNDTGHWYGFLIGYNVKNEPALIRVNEGEDSYAFTGFVPIALFAYGIKNLNRALVTVYAPPEPVQAYADHP